jgi:hypothetical protein
MPAGSVKGIAPNDSKNPARMSESVSAMVIAAAVTDALDPVAALDASNKLRY